MTQPTTVYLHDDTVSLILAECIEAMRSLPDNCIDAIVTDGPYGLEFMGKAWDDFTNYAGFADPSGSPHARNHSVSFVGSPNPTCRNCGGLRSLKTEGSGGRTKCKCESPDFPNHRTPAMQKLQAFYYEWAIEALRVLKPGGHLLAFGGSRTYHRIACAIEDAGFEVRDSIHWIYASGFPKSLNIGNGFGTALKPAHEPVILARKPLTSSVAENFEKHGTGVLNIDASRVESSDTLVRPSVQRNNNAVFGHGLGAGTQIEPSGRWPPNILFAHGETCDGDSCENGCPVLQLDLQNNGASRFFPVFKYQAKAGRKEREASAIHPTVKPVELMKWLVTLVTPPSGVILDPFMGSGTTGVAAVILGFQFIGIEREEPYFNIAVKRIENAQKKE